MPDKRFGGSRGKWDCGKSCGKREEELGLEATGGERERVEDLRVFAALGVSRTSGGSLGSATGRALALGASLGAAGGMTTRPLSNARNMRFVFSTVGLSESRLFSLPIVKQYESKRETGNLFV